MQYKISICLPARNEEWLSRTVQDILEHKEDATEIIVGLDGAWADPGVLQHPDVNVIYSPVSIGQRAITNLCVKLSRAKYVIKADAHTSYDQGFDRKMLEFFQEVGDNVTGVPVMKNLQAFIWKCSRCKWQKPQGPTPDRCPSCNDSRYIKRVIIWLPKRGVNSTSYSFDSEPHFQYFEDWKHRPQYIADKAEKMITETMSLQGSFFMMTREKYWELIGDETLGNWGNQGIQVACATWLSGGRVLTNHKTSYSHLFRTQGGDFGFPYEQSGKEVDRTKTRVKDLFWNKKHPKQIYPVSWLVEKFAPIPGWSDEALQKLKDHEQSVV